MMAPWDISFTFASNATITKFSPPFCAFVFCGLMISTGVSGSFFISTDEVSASVAKLRRRESSFASAILLVRFRKVRTEALSTPVGKGTFEPPGVHPTRVVPVCSSSSSSSSSSSLLPSQSMDSDNLKQSWLRLVVV